MLLTRFVLRPIRKNIDRDCMDLEEAMSMGARIPGARVGAVEIRPVMEIPGLPKK